jgi:hypothetical protein
MKQDDVDTKGIYDLINIREHKNVSTTDISNFDMTHGTNSTFLRKVSLKYSKENPLKKNALIL